MIVLTRCTNRSVCILLLMEIVYGRLEVAELSDGSQTVIFESITLIVQVIAIGSLAGFFFRFHYQAEQRLPSSVLRALPGSAGSLPALDYASCFHDSVYDCFSFTSSRHGESDRGARFESMPSTSEAPGATTLRDDHRGRANAAYRHQPARGPDWNHNLKCLGIAKKNAECLPTSSWVTPSQKVV
ncbi:hypothetical protein QBC45DRAFT_488207 [Copromyces sp. CBS 386.78]|nr:hypothetical protein QBC45DRAFT_488207 [Copromyces sp. CBS 386.78]